MVLMATAGMAVAGRAEKVAKGTEAEAAKMYRRTREVKFYQHLAAVRPCSVAWSSFWFFWLAGGDSHGGSEAWGRWEGK